MCDEGSAQMVPVFARFASGELVYDAAERAPMQTMMGVREPVVMVLSDLEELYSCVISFLSQEVAPWPPTNAKILLWDACSICSKYARVWKP
jgi:hypothetical protein